MMVVLSCSRFFRQSEQNGGNAMAFHKLSIILGLGLLIAAPAGTQPKTAAPDGFKFLTAKEAQALTDKPGTGVRSVYVTTHDAFLVEYVQRSDAGNQVEVHAHTSHYIQILAGSGTLTYGGTPKAPQTTAPGEIRASAVSGGTVIALHAGDYLQIPAGTPHRFNAAKGAQLRYINFSIKS
jgi:quercetin dioxygenase-like cupin family protein